MKNAVRSLLVLFMVLALGGVAYGDGELRFAEVGDFRLENGQVIKDLRVGYRIFGNPNADKTNVVLFPTWFSGTTQDLIDKELVGPGKLIDSSRFYVIAVESIGNGVSTSPSNSKSQPGEAFPMFSIRDMIDAQYLLLTRELHLSGAFAVAGISMGGMQAFQWMVSYPEFIKRAVSIVGTPRLTSSDLLLLQAEITTIETARACGDARRGMQTVAAIHSRVLFTPGYISTLSKPEDFPLYWAGIIKSYERFNPDDWEYQLKAIMGYDIYRGFGGSAEKAAAAVRAKALFIVCVQDQIINPEPARGFAKLMNAEVLEIESPCGHASFLCEKDRMRERVAKFLGD